jgi:hypothetical protein
MIMKTLARPFGMMRFITMTVLLALTLVTVRVAAHPGHDHKVMGTIAAIDGDSVTIKTNDGKERTFQIVPATVFIRGKQKNGGKDDLKVGLRLVVNVGAGTEPLKAKSVQYAAAPTAPAVSR